MSQNTQTNHSGKISWVGNKTSTLPIIPDVRPLCLTITYDAACPHTAVATKVHSRNRQQPSPRDWPMSPLKTTLCSPTHQTMRTPAACARTGRANVRSGHTAVAVLLGLLALVGLPGCWYGPMLADPTMPWPPAPAVAASPIGGGYYDPPAGPPAPPPAPAAMLAPSAPQPFDAPAAPSGHAAPSHDAEKQRQMVRKSQSRYTGPPLAALQGYEPRILHWQAWNDEPPLLPVPTAPVFQAAAIKTIAETAASPASSPAQQGPTNTGPSAPSAEPLPLPNHQRNEPQTIDDHSQHHNHGSDHATDAPDAAPNRNDRRHTPRNAQQPPASLPEMAPPELDSPQRSPDAGAPSPHSAPQPDSTPQPATSPLATASEQPTPFNKSRASTSADAQGPRPVDNEPANETHEITIPLPETVPPDNSPADSANPSSDPPAAAPNTDPQSQPPDDLEDVASAPRGLSPTPAAAPTSRSRSQPATRFSGASATESPERITSRPARQRRSSSLGWRPYRPGRRTHSPRLPIASRPPDQAGP